MAKITWADRTDIKTALGVSYEAAAAFYNEIKASVNALYNGDGAKEVISLALGARGTDHTVEANKNGKHIDFNFFIENVTLEFDPILSNGGPTGQSFIVDVKVGNTDGASMTTIFSTLLSVNAGHYHSSTATIPAVLSTTTIAQYKFISVDVTQIGNTLAGQAGYVTLNGYRT
jgi:hypothetical protein